MEAEETEEEEAVYFMQFCLIWLTLHMCKNLLRPKNIEAVWGWGSHANSLGTESSTRPKPLLHLSGFLGCCSHKNRKWLFAHLAVLFLPCFHCDRVCPTWDPQSHVNLQGPSSLRNNLHHFFFYPVNSLPRFPLHWGLVSLLACLLVFWGGGGCETWGPDLSLSYIPSLR